jgi:uncharacterized repeat protein (TIGR03803 family)
MVFQLTQDGTLSTIYSFSAGADGGFPNGPLIQASDGLLYGTTASGGAGDAGTVFRMTLDGTETVLHSFAYNDPSGYLLRDGLLQASDGYLYGRTWAGQLGIFRMALDGSAVDSIHNFSSGVGYCGELIEGPDGNLYGTVNGDPVADQGTIFRVTPTGSYSVLWIIDRFYRPSGPLVLGLDGALYGTTPVARSYPGTVFRFPLP